MVPEASCMIRRPTSVEPVKATLSTISLLASSSPAVPPGPAMTLRTPGGRPASWASSPSMRAVTEVYDAGLSTDVLPAARAGPSFQQAISSGKLKGTMPVQTP
jgi:hypothetical protein